MHPLLRSLLICLMALALPLQGWAAGRAQHCGATQERMQAARAAHGHGHDQADAAHHHDAAADDAGQAQAGSSCSACAACCHALAAPATGVLLAEPPPEAFAGALPAQPVPPFLTGGLERPPRAALA